jgi:hypothetical protein
VIDECGIEWNACVTVRDVVGLINTKLEKSK